MLNDKYEQPATAFSTYHTFIFNNLTIGFKSP